MNFSQTLVTGIPNKVTRKFAKANSNTGLFVKCFLFSENGKNSDGKCNKIETHAIGLNPRIKEMSNFVNK